MDDGVMKTKVSFAQSLHCSAPTARVCTTSFSTEIARRNRRRRRA